MKPTVLLGTIGLALAGWLGYHNLYVPAQEQIQSIRAQVAQEQRTQHAQAEVAALLKQIERLRTHLPQEPDSSWLVKEAVALVQGAGLSVTTITQNPPEHLPYYAHLSISLDINASYHQIGLLLDRIEHSPQFLRVERMTMNPAGGGGGPMTVQLVLGTLAVPSGLPQSVGG